MEPKDWIELGVLALAVLGILWRLAVAVGKFEEIGKQQAKEISDMRDALKEMKSDFVRGFDRLQTVLQTLAGQTERMNSQGAQIAQLQRDLADIRRGEGFILPIKPHP